MRAVAIAAVLAGAPLAVGEPRLKLTHEPLRGLRMRSRSVANAPVATPTPPTPPPRSSTPVASAAATAPSIEGLDGLRDVTSPVSFSLQLAYQVDGARPTGRGGLGTDVPQPGVDYSTLRAYGFGEVFIATRGVALRQLDTYLALRFQASSPESTDSVDFLGNPLRAPVPPPIATWFERSGYELRSGWAELRNVLPARFRGRVLRIRAGSQHIYGPWVLHVDGLYVTYEGPLVAASLYSGTRHSDYTRDQPEARPALGGAALRLNLNRLQTAVPVTVAGEVLGLSSSEATGEAAVSTSLLQVDWRPRRDIVVLAQSRAINGETANQRVEVRTRFREVTNLVFDVTRRLSADWRWDPSLVSRPTQLIGEIDTEARRYLDLGPRLPQWLGSARAGTLFRENIDVLARIAIASDALKRASDPVNSYVAPYVELGGGLEVRLRRQAALGITALTRRYNRTTLPIDQRIVDRPTIVDPLPDDTQLGEQRFVELGGALKLNLGARRFSAAIEIYGRNTKYVEAYRPEIGILPTSDTRGGGRFSVDAWIGRRIRLAAAYDVSSTLVTAPDVSGYKSLRLMMSGSY